MTKYIPHIYTIRTLTNLHVGGSGGHFDIVDKQVQRDPATQYPTIFASGIKGALRVHFTNKLGRRNPTIAKIFGAEPGDEALQQGKYRFLSADLLVLPEPAEPFKHVSSQKVIKQFKEKVNHLGGKLPEDFLAGIETKNEKEFRALAEELPIIARNHLDNGISENLWYEEVVPRESIFGFIVLAPEKDDSLATFEEHINDKIIQIGANATVGYGLCLFTKI